MSHKYFSLFILQAIIIICTDASSRSAQSSQGSSNEPVMQRKRGPTKQVVPMGSSNNPVVLPEISSKEVVVPVESSSREVVPTECSVAPVRSSTKKKAAPIKARSAKKHEVPKQPAAKLIYCPQVYASEICYPGYLGSQADKNFQGKCTTDCNSGRFLGYLTGVGEKLKAVCWNSLAPATIIGYDFLNKKCRCGWKNPENGARVPCDPALEYNNIETQDKCTATCDSHHISVFRPDIYALKDRDFYYVSDCNINIQMRYKRLIGRTFYIPSTKKQECYCALEDSEFNHISEITKQALVMQRIQSSFYQMANKMAERHERSTRPETSKTPEVAKMRGMEATPLSIPREHAMVITPHPIPTEHAMAILPHPIPTENAMAIMPHPIPREHAMAIMPHAITREHAMARIPQNAIAHHQIEGEIEMARKHYPIVRGIEMERRPVMAKSIGRELDVAKSLEGEREPLITKKLDAARDFSMAKGHAKARITEMKIMPKTTRMPERARWQEAVGGPATPKVPDTVGLPQLTTRVPQVVRRPEIERVEDASGNSKAVLTKMYTNPETAEMPVRAEWPEWAGGPATPRVLNKTGTSQSMARVSQMANKPEIETRVEGAKGHAIPILTEKDTMSEMTRMLAIAGWPVMARGHDTPRMPDMVGTSHSTTRPSQMGERPEIETRVGGAREHVIPRSNGKETMSEMKGIPVITEWPEMERGPATPKVPAMVAEHHSKARVSQVAKGSEGASYKDTRPEKTARTISPDTHLTLGGLYSNRDNNTTSKKPKQYNI